MKIHIEASSFYGKRSGVGRYGLSITQALVSLRRQDRFVLFNFLRPGRRLDPDFELAPNVSRHFIRWFPGRAFSLLMRSGIALPLELFGLERAKVILFPNFVSWSSLLGKKRIAVIHDIGFAHQPEFTQAKNLAYLRRQLPKSLRRSAAVVAVSEFTKQDLIQTYGVAADKISVIHNAIDPRIFNVQAIERTPAALKKYGLPGEYLLFVGTIEPRKNIVGLLDAYAQSFEAHRLPLVLVGNKGWNDESIEQKFADLAKLPIQRLGFVEDDDLAALYTGARAFIYPSFFEGFGIPPLEAMASGCPVICSNTTSLPEIVGDAALPVDPNDIGAIAAAINKLLADKSLQADLKQRGLAQAQKFSWQKSAQQLSELIDSL